MTSRNLGPIVFALLLLTACSGGSSTPSNGLPDNASTSPCSAPYYQELLGRYSGNSGIRSNERACEWQVALVVEVDSESFVCRLRARIESTVEQMIVYDAADDRRYQCLSGSDRWDLLDPNLSADSDVYLNATFPVAIGVRANQVATVRGPYFGSADVEAPYVELFDGNPRVFNEVVFDGSGTAALQDLAGNFEGGKFGTLEKEL